MSNSSFDPTNTTPPGTTSTSTSAPQPEPVQQGPAQPEPAPTSAQPAPGPTSAQPAPGPTSAQPAPGPAIPPPAAPTVGEVVLSEEEKKEQAQKLERQKEIAATSSKFGFANAWNALHGWPEKFEVISLDDPNDREVEEAKDAMGIKSLATTSGLLKPGLYGIPGSEQKFRIKADGCVYPVPSHFRSDKDFAKTYTEMMKAITGQGFDMVTISWMDAHGNARGKPTLSRLLQALHCAEEAHVSVNLGEDVKAWLDKNKSISNETRKEIDQLIQKINGDAAKNELIGELGKSAAFDKYSGLMKEESHLEDLNLVRTEAQDTGNISDEELRKSSVLDQAYGEFKNDPNDVNKDIKQLLTIEKELNDLVRRTDKAELAKSELETYLNSFEKLVDDPEQLKSAKFEFHSKQLQKVDKGTKVNDLNDPAKVLDRIDELDKATKNKREDLLKALEVERKDLEARKEIWKEELGKLKDKFTNDKTDPNKNISTLEERADKLGKKIEDIEKKLETIQQAQTQLNNKIQEMPQKIDDQKNNFAPPVGAVRP